MGRSGAVSKVGKDAVHRGRMSLQPASRVCHPRGALVALGRLAQLEWSMGSRRSPPVCPDAKVLCSSFLFLLFLLFSPSLSSKQEPADGAPGVRRVASSVWESEGPDGGVQQAPSHLDIQMAVQAWRLSGRYPGDSASGVAGRARKWRGFGIALTGSAAWPVRPTREAESPLLHVPPEAVLRAAAGVHRLSSAPACRAPGSAHGSPTRLTSVRVPSVPRPVVSWALINLRDEASRVGFAPVTEI